MDRQIFWLVRKQIGDGQVGMGLVVRQVGGGQTTDVG